METIHSRANNANLSIRPKHCDHVAGTKTLSHRTVGATASEVRTINPSKTESHTCFPPIVPPNNIIGPYVPAAGRKVHKCDK